MAGRPAALRSASSCSCARMLFTKSLHRASPTTLSSCSQPVSQSASQPVSQPGGPHERGPPTRSAPLARSAQRVHYSEGAPTNSRPPRRRGHPRCTTTADTRKKRRPPPPAACEHPLVRAGSGVGEGKEGAEREARGGGVFLVLKSCFQENRRST
eukprot:4271912-Pyramimonas_sp.AAC.1